MHFHSCSDGGCSQDLPFCAGLSCCSPPRQPPSWVPRRAWSCLEGPKSAQQTSCQMSSPSWGFTWAELGSPQGSTQGHRLSRRPKASHWEAEACGWAMSSAQSGQSPAEVPSRGVGQAPGTLLSKGGPFVRTGLAHSA